MSASQVSIDNLHIHKATGELGRQCAVIFAALSYGRDYSRAEIAELTGVRLSSVCGRVNEMIEEGALIEGPKRACRITQRTVGTVKKPYHMTQGQLL